VIARDYYAANDDGEGYAEYLDHQIDYDDEADRLADRDERNRP
jgi:hypothetical protein